MVLRVFVFVLLFISSVIGQSRDPMLDREIAAKHGLEVPPPKNELDPAPEWLQEAHMMVGSRAKWIDHRFVLEEVMTNRIVRARAGHRRMDLINYYPVETVAGLEGSALEGLTLISHVPHCEEAFEHAHAKGFRAIPYVHFLGIHTNYSDQDVFYFEHPEILLKDEEGRWVNTPMDQSHRLHRFLTCANSPSYWKLSLAYVKKMMDMGADGVFIDNVGRRRPCLAPRFNSRRPTPEFEPFFHEHLFPSATHDYAWDRMLQAIRALVKSYGGDKIVLLNSGIGTDVQKDGDACEWESFIYSWAWEGRKHTWQDVKNSAKSNEWFLKAGRRIVASCYLNSSRPEIKDDAFWAFSAARLVDYIFWEGLEGTGAEILCRANLGKGRGPFKESEGVASRIFEKGLVVLNDSMNDQEVQLSVPEALYTLHDAFDGTKTIKAEAGLVSVFVPKKKARVFLLPSLLEDSSP
jgi:hypothetical protein